MQRAALALLARLLKGGPTVIARRRAGAIRNIGRDREADEILATMRAADYPARKWTLFKDEVIRAP